MISRYFILISLRCISVGTASVNIISMFTVNGKLLFSSSRYCYPHVSVQQAKKKKTKKDGMVPLTTAHTGSRSFIQILT